MSVFRMGKLAGLAVIISAIFLIVQPVCADEGTTIKLIPKGSVKIFGVNGPDKVIRSEIPLPQGTMMVCSGQCLIQDKGLTAVAQDKAVFALLENAKHWDLTVKEGRVDFILRPDMKPISFHTPFDSLQTQPGMTPASSDSKIRGFIVVTEDSAELRVTEGSLKVLSDDGMLMVNPKQGIRLAIANPAPAAGGGGTVAGGSTTTGATITTIGAGVSSAAGLSALGYGISEAESDNDSSSPTPNPNPNQ